MYTRRELLKCLAAGGMVVAGELWIPGQKKIFLPKWWGYDVSNQDDLSKIVIQTLRANTGRIVEQIHRNNAILSKLNAGGLLVPENQITDEPISIKSSTYLLT